MQRNVCVLTLTVTLSLHMYSVTEALPLKLNGSRWKVGNEGTILEGHRWREDWTEMDEEHEEDVHFYLSSLSMPTWVYITLAFYRLSLTRAHTHTLTCAHIHTHTPSLSHTDRSERKRLWEGQLRFNTTTLCCTTMFSVNTAYCTAPPPPHTPTQIHTPTQTL